MKSYSGTDIHGGGDQSERKEGGKAGKKKEGVDNYFIYQHLLSILTFKGREFLLANQHEQVSRTA